MIGRDQEVKGGPTLDENYADNYVDTHCNRMHEFTRAHVDVRHDYSRGFVYVDP